MENEWPLVEVLQFILENRLETKHPASQDYVMKGSLEKAQRLLSPYTTKPIER